MDQLGVNNRTPRPGGSQHRTTRNRITTNRGVSLIETLVALVVLSIGLLAMLQSLENAFRSMPRSNRYLQARLRLWNQSQELRSTGSGDEPNFLFSDSKPIFRSKLVTDTDGAKTEWVVYETR